MDKTWCTSGGAPGADTLWANAAIHAGYMISIMSFISHARTSPPGSTVMIMPDELLAEANDQVKAAGLATGRSLPQPKSYTEKLLQRNWHIVKNADAVFAIGKIEGGGGGGIGLAGGTGWAGQMYYNHMVVKGEGPIPLFVFDMNRNKWYQCQHDGTWAECPMPIITEYKNVGLIGSREMTAEGMKAIEDVFK